MLHICYLSGSCRTDQCTLNVSGMWNVFIVWSKAIDQAIGTTDSCIETHGRSSPDQKKSCVKVQGCPPAQCLC